MGLSEIYDATKTASGARSSAVKNQGRAQLTSSWFCALALAAGFGLFGSSMAQAQKAPIIAPDTRPDMGKEEPLALPQNWPRFWDMKERLKKPDLTTLERLRFLTTTDFPPFNFIDDAGRLSGFHVELARAICAELDLIARCQIQALPWDELEPALAKGEGEAIIAGIAISKESRDHYQFSRPYLQFPARFLTRTGAGFDPAAIRIGARVGVLDKSYHQTMLAQYFPSATAVPYASDELMLEAIKDGKIDTLFGDGMRLALWLSGSDSGDCCNLIGGPYLAPEYFGYGLSIAVGQDQHDLKQAMDYALQAINAKGTFAELYLRYFPVGFF